MVAAIIVDDLSHPSLVMAARRSTPPSLAGRWEFPGGKVEPGEDVIMALRRELIEELQLEVILGHEVLGPDQGCWRISDGYVMRTWLAQISSGRPSPAGSHDRIVWLQPSQLATLEWLDADIEVALAVRQRLAAHRPMAEDASGNPFPRQNKT